jgi:hypothetical protein
MDQMLQSKREICASSDEYKQKIKIYVCAGVHITFGTSRTNVYSCGHGLKTSDIEDAGR